MVVDMLLVIKIHPTVTAWFIRGKQLKFCLVFILQSYFAVPKKVRLSTSRRFFIMKIPNKRELQQTGISYLSDIDLKDFMKLCKICTAKPYLFLVINTSLQSDNT